MAEQSRSKKQPYARSRFRAENYQRSSLRELIDESDLSWREGGIFEDFLDQKLHLLSIKSKSGTNIFGLSKDDFQQKLKKLINIVICETPQSSFLVKENDEFKILITKETLQAFQNQMEQLFEVKLSAEDIQGAVHTKACAGIQLLSTVIGLRLYKEIKAEKVKLPMKKITKEEALSDFRKLESFKPNDADTISLSTSIGNKSVDFFTLKERVKAGVSQKKPLHELWYEDSKALAGSLRVLINYYFEQPFKKNKIIEFPKLGIESNVLAKFFSTNYIVSQFSPSSLFSLISLLERKYQFAFHDQGGYVCDPCGGWGGREVGALAHPMIEHFTLVEPNSDLIPLYHDMHQLYAPDKQLVAINKKIEDVTLEELKQNGQENDLAFTSPPYKDKEVYTTSKRDYANEANWQYLLFKLLKTADSVRPGGMLVLNVSATLASDVTQNYNQNNKLHKFAHLNYLGQVYGSNRNKLNLAHTEVFIIFKREAGGVLELPWQQPSPMLAYIAINDSNEPLVEYENPKDYNQEEIFSKLATDELENILITEPRVVPYEDDEKRSIVEEAVPESKSKSITRIASCKTNIYGGMVFEKFTREGTKVQPILKDPYKSLTDFHSLNVTLFRMYKSNLDFRLKFKKPQISCYLCSLELIDENAYTDDAEILADIRRFAARKQRINYRKLLASGELVERIDYNNKTNQATIVIKEQYNLIEHIEGINQALNNLYNTSTAFRTNFTKLHVSSNSISTLSLISTATERDGESILSDLITFAKDSNKVSEKVNKLAASSNKNEPVFSVEAKDTTLIFSNRNKSRADKEFGHMVNDTIAGTKPRALTK